MRSEFKKGDEITFAPYELELAAKVEDVLPNHFHAGEMIYLVKANRQKFYDKETDKIIRRLPVLSFTSPRNIKESKFFKKTV